MTESKDRTLRKQASLEWRRSFAERYERARAEADVTFETIGQHLGVTKGLCHHWASGQAEITAPMLIRLADFLHVDAGWLLSGRGVARSAAHILPMEVFAAG